MQSRLISIGVGILCVIGVGSLVYVTKQPIIVPSESSTTGQTLPTQDIQSGPTSPSTTGTTKINSVTRSTSGDDDDEDEGGSTVATPPVTTTKPATTPTQTTTAPSGITLATVAKHNSRTSCWSAINGSVYDLTSWIPNHPGGEQAILSICGIDGSNAYNGQHGGSSRPATILAGFKVGSLSK